VASTLPRDAEATATVAEGVAAPIVLLVLLYHGATNSDAVTVHSAMFALPCQHVAVCPVVPNKRAYVGLRGCEVATQQHACLRP
jgi:hypothetical protein